MNNLARATLVRVARVGLDSAPSMVVANLYL